MTIKKPRNSDWFHDWTTLHFSGPNNSTLFSDCCGSAVCDSESRCPSCGREVRPQTPRGRFTEAMRAWRGGR